MFSHSPGFIYLLCKPHSVFLFTWIPDVMYKWYLGLFLFVICFFFFVQLFSLLAQKDDRWLDHPPFIRHPRAQCNRQRSGTLVLVQVLHLSARYISWSSDECWDHGAPGGFLRRQVLYLWLQFLVVRVSKWERTRVLSLLRTWLFYIEELLEE